MRKPIPKKERQAVYGKCHGHCAYCGCELEYKDMQVDHVKAVQMGGDDSLDNLLPSCRMCNFYKSTMSIEQFRKQLGKLRSRLEKVYIYRLSKKYGLVKEVDKPIEFYFEKEQTMKPREAAIKLLEEKDRALRLVDKINKQIDEWIIKNDVEQEGV